MFKHTKTRLIILKATYSLFRLGAILVRMLALRDPISICAEFGLFFCLLSACALQCMNFELAVIILYYLAYQVN